MAKEDDVKKLAICKVSEIIFIEYNNFLFLHWLRIHTWGGNFIYFGSIKHLLDRFDYLVSAINDAKKRTDDEKFATQKYMNEMSEIARKSEFSS